MPRSLDPKAVLSFCLECDKDKSPRPMAWARQPNGYQQMALVRAIETIETGNKSESMQAVFDVLAGLLVKWEHMNDPETGESIPLCAENVPRVYSVDEAMEIVTNLANQVMADDKKKSE